MIPKTERIDQYYCKECGAEFNDPRIMIGGVVITSRCPECFSKAIKKVI